MISGVFWRNCLAFFCWFLGFAVATPAYAALAISNLEQQINISNGEFTTTNGTASPTDNSLGLVEFDSSDFDGDSVYFEAVIRCDTCSGGNNQVVATLNSDTGAQQTTVSTGSSTYTRVRSGSLSLPADDYTVRFFRDASAGTAYIKAARLVVVQSVDPVVNTVTSIELGDSETTTSTSAVALTGPKYYQYDNDQFSGTVTAYFEGTLKTTSNSTTATYYFDNHNTGEEWATNPSNMTDNNTSNYASTTVDNDVEDLDSNTSAGTDLGTITKVEIRAFGYQTNGSTGSVDLRPVFSGGDGDNHNFVPGENVGSAAWSSYFDITSDTNAPTWDWTNLDNLDLDVEWNRASASNEGFVSKVEIRVTYEDNTVLAHAQLYNRTNSAVVGNSGISSFDNDYTRVRSSALTTNWDTTNDDEYEVRIYTSDGSNTAALANAKIVLVQSDTGGIQKVETVHHLLTTARTQTNTIYTQESFLNQFDPANFASSNNFEAYFEATMRTTGGTGFAQLYNDSDSDSIDNSVDSELTTTSTSYGRERSADFSGNTDWPTAAKDFDAVLKATSSQTMTASNAWMVLRTQMVDPQITVTIAGVGSSQTNNGVTTTLASTISTLPFGNLTVASAEYAAHEIRFQSSAAETSYDVYVYLNSNLDGPNTDGDIDPYSGSGATWGSPQTWTSPTGSTAGVDTGWFGANTTDADISGWSSSSGKFGPIGTTKVQVMSGSGNSIDDTDYVSYGVEVNSGQPADAYTGTLIYEFVTEF